jgi:hypothetical protein
MGLRSMPVILAPPGNAPVTEGRARPGISGQKLIPIFNRARWYDPKLGALCDWHHTTPLPWNLQTSPSPPRIDAIQLLPAFVSVELEVSSKATMWPVSTM